MLEECFRVLKPGGVLRVGTPDLAFLVNLYREDEKSGHARTQMEQEFLEYFLANEIKDINRHIRELVQRKNAINADLNRIRRGEQNAGVEQYEGASSH